MVQASPRRSGFGFRARPRCLLRGLLQRPRTLQGRERRPAQEGGDGCNRLGGTPAFERVLPTSRQDERCEEGMVNRT